MLHYLEDGPNLAVVPSNAGAPSEPAWWLNLRAAPEAFVDLPGGGYAVIGREASPTEHERLWKGFVAQLDAYESYAAATERAIPVVILEPADPHKPVRATA